MERQRRDKREPDWFWMNKSIVDEYGAHIGAIGIAVYAILARCANDDGHAFPSVRYISRHLGLATNTVIKHLRSLEKYDLITIKLRRDAAGDRDTTEYVLLKPGIIEAKEGVSNNETPKEQVSSSSVNNGGSRKRVSQQMRHGGSNNDTPERTEVSQSVRHGVAVSETPDNQKVSQPVRQVSQLVSGGVSIGETFKDQENNKPKDPDLSPSLSSVPQPGEVRACVRDVEAIAHLEATFATYTPGFKALCTAYPAGRLEGIHEAWQTWQALALESRSNEFVEKVKRLIETTWRGRESRFIPLLKTWLDKGRYNEPLVELDETQVPVALQGYNEKEQATIMSGIEAARRIQDAARAKDAGDTPGRQSSISGSAGTPRAFLQ